MIYLSIEPRTKTQAKVPRTNMSILNNIINEIIFINSNYINGSNTIIVLGLLIQGGSREAAVLCSQQCVDLNLE